MVNKPESVATIAEESDEGGRPVENKKPEIMDFDPEIENNYVEKVKQGIDRFISEGGKTILFDWDETVRGNNFENGVRNYVRRAFIETYTYARERGLRVGVCSLRSIDEIDNLEHLGVTFDEYNGADTMSAYIDAHPSKFHEAAAEFKKLPVEEMTRIGIDLIEKIKSGQRPDGWEVLLQASGEMQTENPAYTNMKNLFMAHRLSEGEKVFLVDDDEGSGGTAEKFGLGVQVPKPAGHTHDK